jgi:hypothetical protein
MKPEKQRIAIAEVCGWTDVKGTKGVHPKARFKGCGYADDWIALPDYCNDLNAMHEAENLGFRSAQQCRDYAEYLDDGNGGHFATATERAEAFLRTIGKWEEET